MFVLLCVFVVASMAVIIGAKSKWYRFVALLVLVTFYFVMPFGGGFYDDSYPMASDLMIFTAKLEDSINDNDVEYVSQALKAFNADFNTMSRDTERRHKFIESIISAKTNTVSGRVLDGNK